ncbi:MAG: hypothetical protein EBU31_17990 [Proteobacteria bacterium]|nr:hypothetical protein [Pseudomonadota bacterium]
MPAAFALVAALSIQSPPAAPASGAPAAPAVQPPTAPPVAPAAPAALARDPVQDMDKLPSIAWCSCPMPAPTSRRSRAGRPRRAGPCSSRTNPSRRASSARSSLRR